MPQSPALLSPAASPAPAHLARLGRFDVRLARTPAQLRATFRLRYEVFHRERGIDAPSMDHEHHVETDGFDPFCDHIVVIDTAAHTPGEAPAIVGTCRALRAPVPGLGHAAGAQFDLGALFARHPDLRFCELGRSCVAPRYRAMRTIEALWCGLWVYACRNGIDAFAGTASFPGTNPADHAQALAFLHHFAPAPGPWPAPVRGPGVDTNLLPAMGIDRHAALRALPPLVRGYLRLNARFSQEAVMDEAFSTIDLLVVARLSQTPRIYRDRMERVTGTSHPALS